MKKILYILIIFIPLLLIVGCKPNQIVTEKISAQSDSSAVVLLENEISQKEIIIAALQSDLTRFKEENLNLMNEVSIHQIKYDTSQPIDSETHKPPISTEIITTSNTQLEKSLKEYELLLREASIENKNLTTQNSNLQLTVESLINENETLKTKTPSQSRLNYYLFFVNIIFLSLLVLYSWLKKKTLGLIK